MSSEERSKALGARPQILQKVKQTLKEGAVLVERAILLSEVLSGGQGDY